MTPERATSKSAQPLSADRRERMAALRTSTVALVLGMGVSVILHELTHWLTAVALGYPSRLFPFGATLPQVNPVGTATVALAGPALSLLLGVVLTFWKPLRRTGGQWHLLWVWTGFISLQEGITYLVVTPFGVGDTAVAARALDWGPAVTLTLMVLGIVGMFWQAWRWARHVRRRSGDDLALARCLAWYPWIFGVLISMALEVILLVAASAATTSPAEQGLILFASFSMTVFSPMAFIFRSRVRAPDTVERLRLPAWPIWMIVAYAGLFAVNLALSLTAPAA